MILLDVPGFGALAREALAGLGGTLHIPEGERHDLQKERCVTLGPLLLPRRLTATLRR